MANERNLEAEYEARLLATSSNLKRYVNETIGIINTAQANEMPEEDALKELDNLDSTWAKIIVDDLAPLEHILTVATKVKS